MLVTLLFALLTPAFDALANIVDGRITRTMGLHAVVFYGTLTNLLFVPLVFIFGLPAVPAAGAWPAIALGGLVGVLFIYPYMLALRSMDTSIVAALFSLGKLFVPPLAFLIAGEALPGGMYAGFFAIVGSALALSVTGGGGKLRINAAFWLMAGCSVMLAFNNVIIKYVLGAHVDVDWITYLFWTQLVSAGLSSALNVLPAYRRAVRSGAPEYRAHFPKFALQSLLAVCGAAAIFFAIGIAPVTFATGVESTQPLMVLLFSLAIARFVPGFLNEKMTRKEMLRKSVFFACMVGGVAAMTLRYG